MDLSAKGICDLNDRLRADASSMVSLWHECGKMCLTRKVQSLLSSSSSTPSDDAPRRENMLLNTVAVEAAKTNAAGCLSWITPSDTPWFVWKPVPQLAGNDAVESWLSTCTEIAQTYLSASNFYNRVHELFLDRVTFGTGVLTVRAGKTKPLIFETHDVGSFVLQENDEGDVTMMLREREFTAMQAKERFQTVPPKIEDDLAQNKPNAKHIFIHAIIPQPDREARMPFLSVWIHRESKTEVLRSGFEELPFFATRYLKWAESNPYGCSPAMEALAEIRGVNYLEELMATLAEVTVTPRVILPQGYNGVPDLRAGGITMGGMDQATFPKEWMTGGKFDVGINLMERKEKMIEALFHKPLFDMFSSLEREITAYEARAREAEKLARFSPAFTQLTTELINPVLERVFMLLWRSNKLPKPPQEAIMRNSIGQPVLMFPQVVQTSRMALAMQALKKSAFATMLELWTPMAEIKPEVFDNLDADRVFRDLLRGDGAPEPWTRPEEEVQEIRRARELAQQQQQQMEMLAQAAKSKPLVEAGLNAAGMGPQQQEAA